MVATLVTAPTSGSPCSSRPNAYSSSSLDVKDVAPPQVTSTSTGESADASKRCWMMS